MFYYLFPTLAFVVSMWCAPFAHCGKTLEEINQLETRLLPTASDDYTIGMKRLNKLIKLRTDALTLESSQPGLLRSIRKYYRDCMRTGEHTAEQTEVLDRALKYAKNLAKSDVLTWDKWEATLFAMMIAQSNFDSKDKKTIGVENDWKNSIRNNFNNAPKAGTDRQDLLHLIGDQHDLFGKYFANLIATVHHSAKPSTLWPAYLPGKDGILGVYTILKAFYFDLWAIGLAENPKASVHNDRFPGPVDIAAHDLAHQFVGEDYVKQMHKEVQVILPIILESGELKDLAHLFWLHHEFNLTLTDEKGKPVNGDHLILGRYNAGIRQELCQVVQIEEKDILADIHRFQSKYLPYLKKSATPEGTTSSTSQQ